MQEPILAHHNGENHSETTQPVSDERDLVDHQLSDLQKAGFPILRGKRAIHADAKGPNKEVLENWIQRWSLHAAINYPIVSRAPSMDYLRAAARRLPAIVVGIGPSLDQTIDYLAKLQNNAIIIATDAALRPLQAKGIRPHLVVNFDCRHSQATMWETVDTEGMVLVANSCTHPKTIESWKGKFIFYNMMNDDTFAATVLPSIYPNLSPIPSCGTVGNGGVLIAHGMGCDPIITVGMDLCYGRQDDQTLRYRCTDHIRSKADALSGNAGGEWIPTENKVLYDNALRARDAKEVEIKGKKYWTDPELDFYRTGLIERIGTFAIPVVDCSPGGILQDLVDSDTIEDAARKHMANAIDKGQTVVRYLNQILPDVKKGWAFEDGLWRERCTKT